MNKTEYKRSIKNIKSLLGLLSASIVLLLIDVLIININGAYYGNWFQKYVSFIYYLIKILILKLADTRKKKNRET